MAKFTQEITVQSQGRNWVLKKAFRFYYADKLGNKINEFAIPEGFITDFASTPRIFYPLFPPVGIYNKAAMVHDYLYSKESKLKITRKDADLYFLQAMEVLGVRKWKRLLMYYAVRIFGKPNYKTT